MYTLIYDHIADYNAAANNFAQMQLDDDEFMREPPQQSLAFKVLLLPTTTTTTANHCYYYYYYYHYLLLLLLLQHPHLMPCLYDLFALLLFRTWSTPEISSVKTARVMTIYRS